MIIRWFLVAIALVLLCLLFALNSKAQLKVGDRAPDFALQDQKGQTIKLSDFLGKKSVVLAFYIRASTPG
jgi:cytochrome oxidase Cu insertion factor (SCO1/SenC/PrrC family)